MPLSYDTTKCKPPATDRENYVRGDLIWATMPVGIQEITEKNYREFYARLHIIGKLDDTSYQHITREEVQRWIGLSTNASLMTRAQFLKTIGNRMDRLAR